jgi:hypothetical protein
MNRRRGWLVVEAVSSLWAFWPVAAVAQTATAPPAACPPPEVAASVIEQGGVSASWAAEPALAVSEPFALRVALCPARAELVRVDATMPEHRHGMNYRARLVPAGAGRWRVDGLVWHMPGRWELLLVVRLDGQEQRLVQSVVLR